MSLKTVASFLRDEVFLVGFVIMVGAGGIAGIITSCKGPSRPEKAAQSDVQLANGDPTWNTVNVYHDGKRGVTCYVDTNHGGMYCFLDITLEDQERMLAYRDAGFR